MVAGLLPTVRVAIRSSWRISDHRRRRMYRTRKICVKKSARGSR
ncbi:hypothetical protein AKJ08_2715 [Vulgatibacter incomptus]|uniref:Uncharacterized protein n=1 Tax=Vulgatibacter incomptus TaxID=1391653 RepID=A0A0K1PFL7_9BACT|nr:hypothetical protein AKJ08_2715 [Vulgatibacter incomptus]